MKPLLGTYVEISIECPNDPAPINEWFNAAFNRIDAIQTKLSIHCINSELNQLNLHLNKWITVSRETKRILQLAMLLMHKSEAKFNPTLGASLIDNGILPDFGFGQRKPSGSENAISFQHNQVRLNEPVIVCLDGIAKGYALDLALMTLRKLGCNNASINAGGDIKAMGTRAVPIVLKLANAPIGMLQNAALASSGTYHSDSHKSRLMNNKGEILPNAQQQWSVLAYSAWRADALTKVAAQTNGDTVLLAALGGKLLDEQN